MHRNASRPDWHQALAAYVEPLAVERRVAVVGDASSGLAAKLAELGARAVFAWDPDVERVRREADRAPHGMIVRALVPGADGGMQRGSFDLVVVADLALFEDAEGLLVRVRRWVGDDGAAVIAIPDGAGAPGALDYYGLFDLVARQFEHVTMIAQLPFFGIALAELGDEDDADHPSVTVDMQLASRDRQPEAFIALASQRGLRLDPYAIIELPSAPAVEDRAAVEAALAAREDLAEAARRVSALEDALRVAQARAALVPDLEALIHARTARAALVPDLEASLHARTARAALVPDLEASLHARTAQVSELESALDARASHTARLEAALAERAREVGILTEELERAQAAIEVGRVATAKLDELLLRAERAEGALAAFDSGLSRLHDAHAGELGRYEEALRERSQATRVLEAELVRRERMVKELVGALEESMGPGDFTASPPDEAPDPVAGPVAPAAEESERRTTELPGKRDEDAMERTLLREANTRLRSQLDSIALDLARREGEAQAAEWTVAELGRKLEDAGAQAQAAEGKGANDPTDRLTATLDELDALRQALAQEHEARVRAESGAELAEARAEIQRQAALLDELRDRPG